MERLLGDVYPRVRRWALTHGLGADDADDVTQAALVSAYRALPGFRFESRFETWLYRIVRRAVADWRRRQVRRGRREVAVEAVESVAPDEGDMSADDARLWRLVRAAFETLPARQREVFDLVELQGRGVMEVAALLEVAEPTVRVHLLRARRAIRRRILERHGALVEDRHGVQGVH
jgi:RNA polymerase sigma-70 factor (ECF subfamily)